MEDTGPVARGKAAAVNFVIPADLFAALGATRESTHAELRQAYLRKCTLYHPDRHPNERKEAAAGAFAAISRAYRVLSDPVLREEYLEGVGEGGGGGGAGHPADAGTVTAQHSLASGDQVFEALRIAKAYSAILPLLRALPAVEAAYQLPTGRLRAGEALDCPCAGVGCVLHELAPALIGEAHRTLLCSQHLWVHRCGEHCTSRDTACGLWGAYLGARWAAESAAAWTLQVSTPDDPTHPSTPYWFNVRVGLSVWCPGVDPAADPAPTPPPHLTPHECSLAECGDRHAHLDGGIWVCRVSGNVHLCTPTQCHRLHRVRIDDFSDWGKQALKSKGGSRAKQLIPESSYCCWATGRPADELHVVDEGAAASQLTVSERLGQRISNADTAAGVEKRVIRFKDERTGLTVSQLVERPAGTAESSAVKSEAASGVASVGLGAAVATELELEQTRLDASVRDEHRARVKREREERGDDGFSSAGQLSEERDRKVLRKHMSGAERLRRLRAGLAESVQRQRSLATADPMVLAPEKPEDNAAEHASVYDLYGTSLLDRVDRTEDEEAGDYNTQYTLAGGAEAIAEEEEDVDEHTAAARRDYVTYANQQMLAARDPSRPVEWFGDPALLGLGDGSGPGGLGQLQEYDGTVYKIMQPPPRFAVPIPKPLGRGRISLKEVKSKPTLRDVMSRSTMKRTAHRTPPHLAGTQYRPGGSREVSPTPSGADRMDLGARSPVNP